MKDQRALEGDSGGPLLVVRQTSKGENVSVIVGISSFGPNDPFSDSPAPNI